LLKETRHGIEIEEDRARFELNTGMALHLDLGLTVVASHGQFDEVTCVEDLKSGMVMSTGKQSATNDSVEARIGVAAGDVDAFRSIGKSHRHPMGSILGRHAKCSRHTRWSEMGETDQADAGDTDIIHDQRFEWIGEDAFESFGVYTEIEKQPALDQSTDSGKSHSHKVYGTTPMHLRQ
jgi:hypothetical protein